MHSHLALFTRHNYFEIYPFCQVYQEIIPFVLFRCIPFTPTPCFVCLFPCQWMSGWLPALALAHKAALQVFYEHVSSYLGLHT